MNKRQLRTIELLEKELAESGSKDFSLWLNLLRKTQASFSKVNQERQNSISRMTFNQVQTAMQENQAEIARLHARTYLLKARLAKLKVGTPISENQQQLLTKWPHLSMLKKEEPRPFRCEQLDGGCP